MPSHLMPWDHASQVSYEADAPTVFDPPAMRGGMGLYNTQGTMVDLTAVAAGRSHHRIIGAISAGDSWCVRLLRAHGR